MSNNTENPIRVELEAELLSYEIDRLVAEGNLKHAQADLLRLDLEELEEKNLEDQGNAEADKLISDAQGRVPLADKDSETDEVPECDCPEGTCLAQLLAQSMAAHPAGKVPRHAAPEDVLDEAEEVDEGLAQVYRNLRAVGASVYGKGAKPKTVDELAQSLVEGRSRIVLAK